MALPPGQPDRRRTDRRGQRAAPPAPVEESWFGAFAGGADTQPPDARRAEAAGAGPESRYEGGWAAEQQSAGDSRFLSQQVQRILSAGQTAFQRIHRAFLSARAVLGLALVGALGAAGAFGVRPSFSVAVLSVAYAVLSISMWLLLRLRPEATRADAVKLTRSQWLAGIGADIACFTALHVLARSGSFNYVALLVLPVLMSGVLMPRLQALATAAGVALILLGSAWLNVLEGGEVTTLMTQAGLAGIGLFVITVLAGELAGRLAREELTAKGSLELARQQAQLNRLVIEEMQDGVLVVDRRGRVRAANPAARQLLASSGLSRPAPFQLRGVAEWEALVDTVERAFNEGTWPEEGRDVVLLFEGEVIRTLRVRIRFTRRRDESPAEEFGVLLLEDVRSMQARIRQEKLAAMGRVSAGIAHEIRNPLAAIAQANALLSEDATTAGQRQLTRMVSDNVDRLKRIVDDVMELAPGSVQEAGVIDATAQVATVLAEWAHAAGVGAAPGWGAVLQVELPVEPVGVKFDGEHLRRVLVNLLDNALRHASKAPGCIGLHLVQRDEQQWHLVVASDGALIPPDVERYLFEPFFSTRSRGTGLGLYICRELCERYGASIQYRAGPADAANRNQFVVTMRRHVLPATDVQAAMA